MTEEQKTLYKSNTCGIFDNSKDIDINKFFKWVEYSQKLRIARQFGNHRGGTIMIKIYNKHVDITDNVHDERSEGGVFIHRSAPIIEFKHFK